MRRTLAAYCQLLDDGRFEEWSMLFAEDALMVVMGERLVGRDAIRGFIEPTQPAEARGRHLLSEPLVTIDGDRAEARTDYAFVAQTFDVLSAGRYYDRLVLGAGGWQFSVREIVFVGAQPTEFTD